MLFEWDDDKERQNIKKHGISFNVAVRVFKDYNRIEYYDLEHSKDEDRYITIGSINDILTVVFVAFTERNEAIRIISARLATNREKERYYNDY